MTNEEFTRAANAFARRIQSAPCPSCGNRNRIGMQSIIAQKLGVTTRTVRRWVSGDIEIPKSIALAMKAIEGEM